MKRRKNYESPASLQQVEVLLDLAFVASNLESTLNSDGIYSNYHEKGKTIEDSDIDSGWFGL